MKYEKCIVESTAGLSVIPIEHAAHFEKTEKDR